MSSSRIIHPDVFFSAGVSPDSEANRRSIERFRAHDSLHSIFSIRRRFVRTGIAIGFALPHSLSCAAQHRSMGSEERVRREQETRNEVVLVRSVRSTGAIHLYGYPSQREGISPTHQWSETCRCRTKRIRSRPPRSGMTSRFFANHSCRRFCVSGVAVAAYPLHSDANAAASKQAVSPSRAANQYTDTSSRSRDNNDGSCTFVSYPIFSEGALRPGLSTRPSFAGCHGSDRWTHDARRDRTTAGSERPKPRFWVMMSPLVAAGVMLLALGIGIAELLQGHRVRRPCADYCVTVLVVLHAYQRYWRPHTVLP